MTREPYIATTTNSEGVVDAFFALKLESIGVYSGKDSSIGSFSTKILSQQVDFIAALPGLGEGNAIELRFRSDPAPDAPSSGRIDTMLRVRVSAADERIANECAVDAYHGIRANLFSIADAYNWVPITDQEIYQEFFAESGKCTHLSELVRREAMLRLDRIELLPKKQAIGFSSGSRQNHASQGGNPSIYHCFRFVRNYNSLERLFNILLLQRSPVIVSVAIMPTNLTQDELEFMFGQVEQ